VLSLAVNDFLYRTMPTSSEGELTRIKSATVSTIALARVSRRMGFHEFMLIGKGLGRGADMPDSVHANVTEAVIAAVYLDGGFDAGSALVLRLVAQELEAMTAAAGSENAKSQLQEYAQRKLGRSPRYRVLSETGPQHGKTFVVTVDLGGRIFPGFSGHTKKEAEQGAARLALDLLRAQVPAAPAPAAEPVPDGAMPTAPAAAAAPPAQAGRPAGRPGRRHRGRGRGRGQLKAGAPAARKPAPPKPHRAPAEPPAPKHGPKPGRSSGDRKNPYDTLGTS
jgi:ribonuclease-3